MIHKKGLIVIIVLMVLSAAILVSFSEEIAAVSENIYAKIERKFNNEVKAERSISDNVLDSFIELAESQPANNGGTEDKEAFRMSISGLEQEESLKEADISRLDKMKEPVVIQADKAGETIGREREGNAELIVSQASNKEESGASWFEIEEGAGPEDNLTNMQISEAASEAEPEVNALPILAASQENHPDAESETELLAENLRAALANTIAANTSKLADSVLNLMTGTVPESGQKAAWIAIPDTVISYPVMQADNNEYYLNHNADGEKSTSGAIFADYESNFSDPNCRNILIYGHNMKDMSMFGGLKYYKSMQYYFNHPIIIFQQNDQEAEQYRIFSVFLIPGTYVPERDGKDYRAITFRDTESFQEWIEFFAAKSIIETGYIPASPDKVITLSTCSNDFYDARFVIMAAKQ